MTGNKAKVRLVLQPRDHKLLREAATLKVFDRQQAQICAGFNSAPRANTRLPKLVSAGLLSRFFIGTENGGKKSLYSLTLKGAAVAGVSFSGIKRNRDRVLIGDLFVAHQLHINDIYIDVKHKQIPVDGIRFKQWLVPKSPLSGAAPIIPDGLFQLDANGTTVSCFLEVDLGGESSAVWARKIDAYLTFAVTGQFRQIFGEEQFRVLVVTTSERRLRMISKLIAKHTEKVFWLSTFELINLNGFWSAVWFRPAGDQAGSLFERSI